MSRPVARPGSGTPPGTRRAAGARLPNRRARLGRLTVSAALLLLTGWPAAGAAFDAGEAFAKGTRVLSLQATGGAQINLESADAPSNITFVGVAPRLSYLPFAPFGSRWYRVAIDPGLEAWAQYFLHPQPSAAAGLKASLRLHGLGFGRVVPYVEINAGAGATGLYVQESRSTFTFILEGGPGLAVFLTKDVALTAGYRFQHFSNGNTSHPNSGYESQSGVAGVSIFFH